MDKIKITNHQLFSLTACVEIGGSIIVISAVITSIAKQDAWITALLTPLFGIPVIWVYWFLGSQHPGMTFIGIIKEILGKWVGSIVAVGFVLLCLSMIYNIPWYIGNFITTQAMPETPAYIINSLFIAATVIAVLYGIETIARASEVFIYFTSILVLIAMLLVLPNARIGNLQPVFEKGIVPILKSSVILSCFITFHLVLLLMIIPVHMVNITKAKKPLFTGYLWAAFILFIGILMTILVLGSALTSMYQYPTYILAREINVGVIFSRLEFIILAPWIITQFMINILFFYASVVGISELLGLTDYKRIALPLGLIASVLSTVVYPNVVYQANWISLVWPPLIITYGFILPVLLLVVFWVKKQVCKFKTRNEKT